MSDADLPEMPCRELVERVTDYLEAAMSSEDRTRLEAHLEECDACAEYLAQLGRTLALTGELREADVDASPPLRDELMASFRAWRDDRA